MAVYKLICMYCTAFFISQWYLIFGAESAPSHIFLGQVVGDAGLRVVVHRGGHVFHIVVVIETRLQHNRTAQPGK